MISYNNIVEMSRSQPYRSRLPVHIMQLLDVASRITLFLVGQGGPLSFTFKDRLDNKYRTQIGPDLRCSCCPQRNDHCIHTVYVLLRIFRVSVDNPIIWQAAYVDSQLEDLLAGKHSQAKQRRPRPQFQEIREEFYPELPSSLIQRRAQEKKLGELQQVTTAQRMMLGEEAVCPICQEDMRPDMCLSWCRVGCGNNFHLQCLKVWARHRTQEDASVNCPMCRAKFSPLFLSQLDRQEREHARKESEKIKVSWDCSGCGLKSIPNAPHKCLLCTTYELCQPCYASGKHVKHPFVRQDADGRWRGADQRRPNELKLKSYIESKRKETFNDEMLKKLRKIEEDPAKLLDFVASAYPYVSRYISDHIDPLKKMDFSPSDLKCQKCASTKMLFLRRLSCGHFIDHECLKDCILKDRFYCAEDGSQFLKGFENLRQKEKENDNKRQQQLIGIGISSEFDPSHIEQNRQEVIPSRESYNFVSSHEEPTLTEILSARQSSSERRPDQLRTRLTSNIIRQPRLVANREHTPQREVPMPPPPRQTPPRPEIRVRNVVPSSKGRGQSLQNRHPPNPPSIRQQSSKKKRQDLQFMIQALIGRKLK